MSKAGFWDNPDEAQYVVSQLSMLKAVIEPVEEMQHEAKDLNELFELATDESDEDELVQLKDDLSALRARNLGLIGVGGHDSSDEVIAMFSDAFGEAYHQVRVGERIEIGSPD